MEALIFAINSILLGVGLAMDAFSVSLANGLRESKMKLSRMCGIAGVFAAFQAMMPMAGWTCVHTVLQYFQSFQRYIPWIALVLLFYIGGKMLIEREQTAQTTTALGFGALLLQGIATSIDALSVGFTIAEYGIAAAVLCSLIIAVVTFIICMGGLAIGKKFGTRLAGKANMLGGIILMMIGLEIFINGVFLK